MKKYFTIAVLFYLSVVAQKILAESSIHPQHTEGVVNTISNTGLSLKKEQLSPELMQCVKFASSGQETEYEAGFQQAGQCVFTGSDSMYATYEELRDDIIKLLKDASKYGATQLYYGVLAAVIDTAQFEILAHFIYRPLSLLHCPFNADGIKFTSMILNSAVGEWLFRGMLLPGINSSIEYLVDSAKGSDEKIFMASNAFVSVIYVVLMQLLPPNPSMMPMMHVFNTMWLSFIAGLLYRYCGLGSAVIYHATSNTIAYLLFVRRGYL